ncbi:hypothetical protein AK812_SmicGene44848 [Symbiodinium microadriaticum]|uniref:Uncharacterized protein n=1 Tax=Symbiodinium microadriaticum TaxID=2951 RepID=A0A1Q9BXE9_SYMMI|nr:hypothetical protein AK812_SmicGene44848 [Symbiodinium microadriaticum]
MLTFSGMQVQLCAAEVPQFRTAELKACQDSDSSARYAITPGRHNLAQCELLLVCSESTRQLRASEFLESLSFVFQLYALVGGCDTAEEDEREEEFVSWAEGRRHRAYRAPQTPEQHEAPMDQLPGIE